MNLKEKKIIGDLSVNLLGTSSTPLLHSSRFGRYLNEVSVSSENEFNGGISDSTSMIITSDIHLNKSIEIYGIRGLIISGNSFIIDAQSNGRCFYIHNSTVTMENLFITNGYSTFGGGVLIRDYASVTFFNCSIHTNSAQAFGGGIYSQNYSSIVFQACDIFDNSAAYGGGVMANGKLVNFSSTIVHDNSAAIYGGGIFITHDTAFIDDSAIYDNIAPYGGGVFDFRGTTRVTDTDVFGNYAYVWGGGFYIHRAQKSNIINTCVYSNYAGARGGGIYIYIKKMTLTGSHIYNNYADDRGGGFYSYYGSASLSNTTFTENIAMTSGGGIYFYDAGRGSGLSELANCRLHNNTAVEEYAGGLYIQFGQVEVSDCDFAYNTAVSGGGICVGVGSTTEVNFKRCSVHYNQAVYGGGLFVTNGLITFTNSSFHSNLAVSPQFSITSSSACQSTVVGGCFYSSNYPDDYNHDESCNFYVIGANGGGGVLDVVSFDIEDDSNDYLKVGSTKYYGDNAPDGIAVSPGDVIKWRSNDDTTKSGFEICFSELAGGGAVYTAGGDLTMQACEVTSNHATHNGGGLYIENGRIELLSVDIEDNYAGSEGIEVYFSGGTFDAMKLNVATIANDSFGGSSIQAATCISDCTSGQSGSCASHADWSGCYVNCLCLDCVAGTFAASEGSTSSIDCESCSAGRYSSSGATSCNYCDAGRYASDDPSDMGGGQIVQVFSAAITCNPCPAGHFGATTASVVCQACDSGRYSVVGQANCSVCAKGSYSGNGQANCSKCAVDTYADSMQSQSCIRCPSWYTTSQVGSSSCDEAIENYYIFNLTVKKCAKLGTRCYGGYLLPLANKNYWIDTEENNPKYLTHPYYCPRDTCKGASRNDTYCWTEYGFTSGNWSRTRHVEKTTPSSKWCNPDTLLCRDGATGPLCGACLKDFYFSASAMKCKKCTSSNHMKLYLNAIIVVVVMLLAGSIVIKLRSAYKETVWVQTFEAFFFNGDAHVLFSTYQIIQSITFSLSIRYPAPFSDVIQYMSFLNFDFPSVECSGIGVHDTVYILSTAPVVVAVIFAAVGVIRWLKRFWIDRDSLSEVDKIKESMRIKSETYWSLMLISYISLPPILSYQLSALDCFPLKSGKRYLQVDSSVDCDSIAHREFVIVDMVLITAYLSVPVLWLYLLKSKQENLFPPGVDSGDIPERRKMDSELTPLYFLFAHYRSTMAYWEVLEMFRRILFIGVIPLIAYSVALQSCIGIAFSYVSTIVYREMTPFNTDGTNALAYVANVAIFLIYAGSLLVETGFNQSVSNFLFGLILCSVNFSVLLAALLFSGLQMKRARKRLAKHREKFVQHVEYACGFSAQKFSTTFDVLEREVIPPSHCTMFYFSSLRNVTEILKHGIPVDSDVVDIDAHGSRDGIVFTTHRPHFLSGVDKAQFSSVEAVVVCSLPKVVLKQCHPNCDHLFYFPKKVLLAMRGCCFEGLPNQDPWKNGLLLLPPHCIKRAYQLRRVPKSFMARKRSRTTALLEAATAYLPADWRPSSSISDTNPTITQPWEEKQVGLTIRPPVVIQDSSDSSDSITPSVLLSDKQEEIGPLAATLKKQRRPSFSFDAITASFNLIQVNNDLSKLVAVRHSDIPLLHINSIEQYLTNMDYIRRLCAKNHLIPLYHYTRASIVPLILRSGFRMSTQGQGDGGVYFSTLGPIAYGLGTSDYESNIIIDCYGKERMKEYKGKHMLDVCLVYAVEPLIVERAPGGRDNALVVPKVYFEEFSLPHQNGSFFLRADRILGAFLIDPNTLQTSNKDDDSFTSPDIAKRVEREIEKDMVVQRKAKEVIAEKQREIAKHISAPITGNDYNEYDDNDEEVEEEEELGEDDKHEVIAEFGQDQVEEETKMSLDYENIETPIDYSAESANDINQEKDHFDKKLDKEDILAYLSVNTSSVDDIETGGEIANSPTSNDLNVVSMRENISKNSGQELIQSTSPPAYHPISLHSAAKLVVAARTFSSKPLNWKEDVKTLKTTRTASRRFSNPMELSSTL